MVSLRHHAQSRIPVSLRKTCSVAVWWLFALHPAGWQFLTLMAAHLFADLGNGCIVGDTVQCRLSSLAVRRGRPLRDFPAGDEIPAFARQPSYPVVERHGLVFFFNGPKPLYSAAVLHWRRPRRLRRRHAIRSYPPLSLVASGRKRLRLAAHSGCPRPAARWPGQRPADRTLNARKRARFAVVGNSWRNRLTGESPVLRSKCRSPTGAAC